MLPPLPGISSLSLISRREKKKSTFSVHPPLFLLLSNPVPAVLVLANAVTHVGPRNEMKPCSSSQPTGAGFCVFRRWLINRLKDMLDCVVTLAQTCVCDFTTGSRCVQSHCAYCNTVHTVWMS